MTGYLLELFAGQGLPSAHPAIVRAAAHLRSTQRGDGSWDSATGARFIHGTSWAVRGLVAAGAEVDDPAIAAGVNWLLVQQQESGGWGENALCSAEPQDCVAAPTTAIQTAWAILALVATGHADHDATRRGVEFLLGAQADDGSWHDTQLTVRDSPSGAWYRNDLHSAALPLIALSRWIVAVRGESDASPIRLRLISADMS